MIKVIRFEVDNIFFTGDLHGNFRSIGYNIKSNNLIENALIVCCGDIGLGFNKPDYYKAEFNRLKKILSKRNVYLVFLRGNHDDPSYFDNKTIFDKRIKAVEDYTVLSVEPLHPCDGDYTKNILCIGGGISIDRVHRKQVNMQNLMRHSFHHLKGEWEEIMKTYPRVYWEDEPPVYREDKLNELSSEGIRVGIVATHTAPSFCQPLTKDGIKGWMELDKELEVDLNHERGIIDKIYKKLITDGHPLKKWFYGHYHFYNRETINSVEFTLIDMERNGLMNIVELKD